VHQLRGLGGATGHEEEQAMNLMSMSPIPDLPAGGPTRYDPPVHGPHAFKVCASALPLGAGCTAIAPDTLASIHRGMIQ